jgi:hypothetical protein
LPADEQITTARDQGLLEHVPPELTR